MNCPDCKQVAPGHTNCRASCYAQAMRDAAAPYERLTADRLDGNVTSEYPSAHNKAADWLAI